MTISNQARVTRDQVANWQRNQACVTRDGCYHRERDSKLQCSFREIFKMYRFRKFYCQLYLDYT